MPITIVVVLLVGCSVGPDYVEPTIDLPVAWEASLKQPTLPDQASLGFYWRDLADPVLDALIENGLENNQGLQGTALRIDEALANYRIQRAEFLPDIDLQGNVARRRRSAAIASAISSLHNDYAGVGGLLRWEIDIFGRVRRLTESASASIEANVELYHGSVVTLLSEITLGYVRYRALQTSIELTKQNIRSQEDSLHVAQDRFAAGIAPELDVRQAESNLGETKAAMPVIRIMLAQQKHNLAVLCGVYPEEIDTLLAEPRAIPAIPDMHSRQLPLQLLRQRPDLRQAERRLAAQHALIGAAEAELYPIVSLPGSFTFEAINTLENAFKGDSLAYSVGPRVDLNFLDFGRVRGNIATQEIRTLQLEQEYRQLVLQAVQEVENALVALAEQQVRRMHLNESVKASQKSAELVKSLYVSGLTDFQNVLDSERRLFSQQISLTESTGQMVEAYVQLYRALGGGWQNLGLLPESSDDDSTLGATSTIVSSERAPDEVAASRS
jgi:NodT family efflux transporter outer membrane factor (OMF) lipoprotein